MHCVYEFKLRHGLSRNHELPGTRSQTNGYEMEPLTLEHFQGIGFNFRGDISQWHVFERPGLNFGGRNEWLPLLTRMCHMEVE